MSKNFKDSFYYTLTKVLLVPVSLVSTILVARLLGPTDKGVFNFLPLLMGVGVYIFQFGCGAGVLYFVSSEKYKSSEVAWSAVLNSLVQGLVLVGLLWGLFNLGAFDIISSHISPFLFMIFLISVPLEAVYLTIEVQLTAIGRFRMINKMLIYNALLFVIAFLIMVYGLELRLEGAIIAFVIQKVLYQGYIIIRAMYLFNAKWTFSMDFIKKCYSYGIRAWLGNMANRSNAKLDGLLIGLYLPASSLGIYNVGYRMINYVNSAFVGADKIFFNKLTKLTELDDQKDLFYRMHRVFIVIAVLLLGLVSLLGYPLIVVLFGIEYKDAYPVLLILAVGMLPYFTTRRLIQKYLSAMGQPFAASKVELVTAIVGVGLYFILIPNFGMNGAAMATSIAFIAGSVYAVWLLNRQIPLSAVSMLKLKREDLYYLKSNLKKLYKKTN